MRKVLTRAGLGLGLLLAPTLAAAQKALVYCPVAIDRTGCDAIVAALTGPAWPGGVELGYDGSAGTVDLRAADLFGYHVFLVPSLADDADVRPYGFLRDPVVVEHLRAALLGRLAAWSGMPDQGSANRGPKDQLLRNLAAWAGADFGTAGGPGLVALLDLSDDEGARYDWLRAITPFRVNSDVLPFTYDSVRALAPAATAALAGPGGPIAFPAMAAFGFMTLTPTPGISLDAVGSTGTSQGGQVVLITLAAANTSGPVITTDKLDYQPGDTVTFSGSGWQANEVVTIVLHEDPLEHSDQTIVVTADGFGNFTNRTFAIELRHLLVRFVATASGGSSGSRAQTTFTDRWVNGIYVLPQSVTVAAAGGEATYSIEALFTASGSGDVSSCPTYFEITAGLPAGAFASTWSQSPAISNFTFPLTVSTSPDTPPGGYQLTLTAYNLGCNGTPAVNVYIPLGVVATKVFTGGWNTFFLSTTDWATPSNWYPASVPTAGEIVEIRPVNIPGPPLPFGTLGVVRNPVIPAGTFAVRDLIIAAGASVQMPNAATLEINGEMRNSGTFNATAGLVRFKAPGSATSVFSGSNQFQNVECWANPRFDASSGALIKVGGNWNCGGFSLATNPTTLEFNGTSGFQGAGNSTLYHLVVSGGSRVQMGGGSVVGNLTVSNGMLETFAALNRTTPGGTLTVADGATLRMTGTSTVFPANFATRTLGPTSTVEYAGSNTNQVVLAESYGHLTLGGLGTRTIPGGTTVRGNLLMTDAAAALTTGDIVVHGNWLINGSATFNPGSNVHELRGNLNRIGGLWSAGGTLLLTGTALQTLTGTLPFTTFANLTVNNPAGASLANTHAVTGVLHLEDGVLGTGANTLQANGTVTRGAGAACAAGTSCFVDGNLRRAIASGNSTTTWDIGTGATYAPASVAITSASANGFLTGSTRAAPHPQHATSGFGATDYVNRYWTLTASGFTATSYDATFQFANPGDLIGTPNTAALEVRKFKSPSTWTAPASSSSTATTATGTGFTGFSDFAVGVVALATQVISFDPLASRSFGDPAFLVSATGGASGNPVTFSVTAGNGTVCSSSGTDGSTITINGVGSCTIRASQAGNSEYLDAVPVDRVLQVTPAAQVISFDPLTAVAFGEAPFLVSATGGASGNPVTFSVTAGNGTVCSSSGTNGATITINGVGSCTVRASQAGNTNYTAAAPVDQTLQVNPAAQVISFDALGNKTFLDVPFPVSASGGASGNPVTFSILVGNGTVCSSGGSNGATITILGAGGCTVRASQAGHANYAAADPVDQPFTVNPAAQVIGFAPLATKTFGNPAFAVSATGGASGNPVTFSILVGDGTVCSSGGTNGATITILGAGGCTVRASQAGNTNYAAADPVDQGFTVNPASQAISFAPLGTKIFGNDPFQVSATGGASGNPVTFSILVGDGTVCSSGGTDGATITILGAGGCTVRANQAGSTNYAAADPVDRAFTVNPATTLTTLSLLPDAQQYSDLATLRATVTLASAGAGNPSGSIQFKVNGSNAGSAVPLTCAAACTAEQSYTIATPNGGPALVVSAVFTSSNANQTGSVTTVNPTLAVSKEDATIYDETVTPGQILVGGSGTLIFRIKEKNPETNAGAQTAAGDISHASVTVSAQGVLDPGKQITFVCGTPVSDGDSGYDESLSVSCSFGPVNTADTYDVTIAVVGSYYTGSGATLIQVTDPALGFATGGGWYWHDGQVNGDKVNFGFMAKSVVNNKKTQFRGAMLVIRHLANGDVIKVKSNVFDGYSIMTGATCSSTTFSGKANYTYNGTTLGNERFTGFGEDCDPTASDKFALYHALSPNEVRTTATLNGLVSSAKLLQGGNIQVPKVK